MGLGGGGGRGRKRNLTSLTGALISHKNLYERMNIQQFNQEKKTCRGEEEKEEEIRRGGEGR